MIHPSIRYMVAHGTVGRILVSTPSGLTLSTHYVAGRMKEKKKKKKEGE
jgi:hypothetical protein